MYVIPCSRHCMLSPAPFPWLCHSLSERGSLQSESYQVQCMPFMLQGWSVKIAWGMFSSHSTCLLDVSNSITLICQLGLTCGIVKQRQWMSWHCSSSYELSWKVPSRSSSQRHVPQLLSHKWTRAFSMTTSKTLMSCEPCVGISGVLKVKRSAHDLW